MCEDKCLNGELESPDNEQPENPDEGNEPELPVGGEPSEGEQPEDPEEPGEGEEPEQPEPSGTGEKMTLYYSKRTGDIKNYVSCESDMSFYGDDEPDFVEIWDYVVLPRDDYVLANFLQFEIVDGEPKLKDGENIGKYI